MTLAEPRTESVASSRKIPAAANPSDIYERVTERMIELLEQGVKPWEPSHFVKTGMPRNFHTGQAYRGVNVFLLGMQRYASPYWLTFVQAKALGGNVRKGEKGSLVVKYGEYTPKEDAGQDDEPQRRGYLKGYTVFNACQIEGIEFPEPVPLVPVPPSAQCERARLIVAGMPNPPTINEGRHSQAFYRPATDTVEMPARAAFASEASFYKTLFHELVHATGHGSRLARQTLLEGQSMKNYSQEELTAEMGAAFLAAHAEILDTAQMEESAAYVQGWLSVLKAKQNRKWLVQAAAQAQKAADWVLGI